ncbi:11850_t:CDS:2 [Ambispora leptoticha]|uniref:11850_t:CDS:1 n=1 Tax=Ambispora leptoticha TaxID=144679 RepID=A0A9N9AF32_9GLOM|nr:11850_t:CDS:2 [Ambispora leptoticha]
MFPTVMGEVQRAVNEMHRLADTMNGMTGTYSPCGQSANRRLGDGRGNADDQVAWLPYVDGKKQTITWLFFLYNLEDQYVVQAELPGVRKEEVNLELRDNSELVISGKTQASSDFDRSVMTVRERSFGNFRREFVLPGQLQTGKVEARMENGVLEVRVNNADTIDVVDA